MPAPDPPPSFLLAGQSMDEPRVLGLGQGQALVFSRGRPDEESRNEDAAALVGVDERRGVLAIADGAGGHASAAEAARRALEALRTAVVDGARGGAVRSAVLDGFEAASRHVADLGSGAATTLAVVEIDGDRVRPYHVGDTEILVVGQRGRVRLQIVPHSPTGYAVEAGLLEESEAIGHEDRHIVSNVVGAADMRIEVGSSLQLQAFDTVLLASDGLFDNLRVSEIASVVRKGPLDLAGRVLAARAAARMAGSDPAQPSKPDDLTFILYRRDPRATQRRPEETT